MPLRIVTDNGREFANTLVTELTDLLGMQQKFVAPYNSRANGKVENRHKLTQAMVRAYIDEHPQDWDLLLPFFEFAINTSPNEATTYTPFYLHFGRHPIQPMDCLLGSIGVKPVTITDFVKDLDSNRDKVFTWVAKRRETLAEKAVWAHDKKHAHAYREFKPGDTVRIRNNKRVGPHGMKYNNVYSKDLYTVTEALPNKKTYRVRDIQREKPPFIVDGARLLKVYHKHEIQIHQDDQTISCTENTCDEDAHSALYFRALSGLLKPTNMA
jgi:hypothetical protein